MNATDLFGFFEVETASRIEEAETEPEFNAGALSIVECEDGPRILDQSFALALGYDRPRSIRNLIERYRSQLHGFGNLLHREANYRGAGRPTVEYLLNQGQVNYLVTRSSLPNADAACILIAKVFTAWQNGKVTTSDMATAVALRDAEESLAETSPPIAEIYALLAQCATKNDLQCTEINLVRRIDDLAGRRNPTTRTWGIGLSVVHRRYGGLCPCCGKVTIVDANGIKLEVCQWDHFYIVTKAGLLEGWPICSGCNRMLETERTSYVPEFGVFIKRVKEAEAASDPLLTNGDVELLKGAAT